MNNIEDNQNENVFLYNVTERNGSPDPEPQGNTTFNHTYNNNNNIQLGIDNQTNTLDFPDEAEEQLDSMRDFLEYLDDKNDPPLNQDEINVIRNIDSNRFK